MTRMKFAEHMLLEAKAHGLAPYVREDQEMGTRCALGLVESGYNSAESLYPWLEKTLVAVSPCGCQIIRGPWTVTEPPLPVVALIAHIFNEHVARGVRGFLGQVGGKYHPEADSWTMERLADWINSVDPTVEIPSEGCDYEAPETSHGAADGGYRCGKPAVAVENELAVCAKHQGKL